MLAQGVHPKIVSERRGHASVLLNEASVPVPDGVDALYEPTGTKGRGPSFATPLPETMTGHA